MSQGPDKARRRLLVRLRNWVGDVVLSVPTLRRLEVAGYELHLLGKGWSADLLSGFGWRAHRMAETYLGRIRQLRDLRRDLGGDVDCLVFPYSFSSALEARLAGLAPVGFAVEARSWLLRRAVPMPVGLHTLDEYWSLGQGLLGLREAAPDRVDWILSPAAESEAEAIVRANGLEGGFVLACPFSGGTVDGERKRWPGFAEYIERLACEGRRVVLCPGSELEMRTALRLYPSALAIPGVGMGAYGALLRRARLAVSNDTGPGHLAAAVGARLLSVLGPTPLGLWRPRGPGVVIEHGWPEWPSVDRVWARSRSLLDG